MSNLTIQMTDSLAEQLQECAAKEGVTLRASFEFDDKHNGKRSFVVHMLGNFLGGRSQFR